MFTLQTYTVECIGHSNDEWSKIVRCRDFALVCGKKTLQYLKNDVLLICKKLWEQGWKGIAKYEVLKCF